MDKKRELVVRGIELAEEENYNEAIKHFNEAIKLYPQDAKLWYLLGLVYCSFNKLENAMDAYSMAIQIDPRLSDAWNEKGSLLGRFGKHGEAIECFDRALEINDNKGILLWKGESYNKLGKLNDAISCYDRILANDPKYIEAWIKKGKSLALLERHDDAIRCFNVVLDLDPNNIDAWINKGISFSKLKLSENANECFRKSIEIDPNCALGYGNLGISLMNEHKYDDAAQNLEISKKLFIKCNLHGEAEKIDKYKEWAINAPKLISKINKLDNELLTCLKNNDIVSSIEIIGIIQGEIGKIGLEYKEKGIPPSVSCLLIEKLNQLKVILDSMASKINELEQQ